MYAAVDNTASQKPANKALELKKQSRQMSSSMALDCKGPSSSSSTSITPVFSLATTKAVKPANKTAAPKQALQTNILLRQRHQQQLQQIRAIRRKRTVAFAVNHESAPQPHTACVVSADCGAGRDTSSSAQSQSTRDTIEFNRDSTVTCDPTFPSRASTAIRDSLCTFRQSAPAGFGEDPNRRPEKEFPIHDRINTGDGTQNASRAQRCKKVCDATDKTLNPKNRLVVDVRCAEEAADAISKNIPQATNGSCDICRSAPVPVTPTYLAPSINEINPLTEDASPKRENVEIPSKKQRCSPRQEKEEAVASIPSSRSSEFPTKLSKKPKIKRVRYDVECIPVVEINQDIWRQVSSRFRKQSQFRKSTDGNMKNLVLPPSQSLLQSSVVWIPSSREEWEDCVSEMKGVCTSAAFRRWSTIILDEYQNSMHKIQDNNDSNDSKIGKASTPPPTPNSSQHQSSTTMKSFHPPLSQAFIKDRIRIDDPLRGYQIRHATGGWLQGFLVWTNFTVWTLDFQWDSTHPASGLPQLEGQSEGFAELHDDGTLSKELQALPRGEQDPLDGGTVLKQVAEISLLGGLGCGELLLRKAIEDIRKSKNSDNSDYKFVVLQATEGSRRFYEKMGFVRVGAVCRYRWAEYCTKENVSVTTGKKLDVQKVEAMEVDRKFHGYRHWTYTNESCKSLNAHGGPSVMMCLKLDSYNEENRLTVSELIRPQLVTEKPTIHLFGNVANPESENLAPTRKSQRRSSSNWRSMEQEQEEKSKNKRHDPSSIRESESVRIASATSSRRTSNRSKRGRNAFLEKSCFILYGNRDKNSPNQRDENTTGNATKRKRQTSKEVRLLSQEKGHSFGKIIANCDEKNIHGKDLSVATRPDFKSSEKSKFTHSISDGYSSEFKMEIETQTVACSSISAEKSVAAQFVDDANKTDTKTASSGESWVNTTQELQRKAGVIAKVANPTEVAKTCDGAQEIETTNEQSTGSSSNNQLISPSVSENAVVDTTKAINEAKTRILNYASLIPITSSRKRSRQRATKVSASTLLKQKVIKQPDTKPDFHNQVVIRRSVQSCFDHGHDNRNTKRRKDNFRWRYNGGLMIDHRYEFCYYFVLDYNESKKSMTVVPMVKDGVFERTIDSENDNDIDEQFLGRPRYQCNILETDKNWIRDEPLDKYSIVRDAVAVFDTSLVAQEAWDIGGNGSSIVFPL